MRRFLSFFGILVLGGVLLGAACNSDNRNNPIQPQPVKKPLALLQPAGGEHYHVGDQVTISWTIDTALANKYGGLSSVKIQLRHMSGGSLVVQDLALDKGSIFPPETSYVWTVDDAHSFDSCKVVIGDYINASFPRDSSGFFSTK